MSKLKYSLLFSLLASLCFSSTVMADVNMGAGAKFAWDNYKRAVLDYSVVGMDENTGTGGMTLMDYPSPRFGGNFQVVINRRIVAMLDVDFGTFKHTVYTLPYGVDPAEPQKITQKYMKFGIGLEGKFYLTKPADQKAAPYVFLGLGKFISKTKSPYAEGDLASSKMISKLASPFYLTLGFGAEFFVNESFSLGADIFGFRMETAKGSAGGGAEFDNPYYTGDQTLMNFYMYSALTVNFTFVKEPSTETEQPQNNDVWGSGATQQNNTGWGTGGDASATGGWGTPAATPAAQPAAPAANSWGTPAAAPAAQPAPAPANSGWGTPAAAPAPAQPVQPAPAPAPAQPKPKKKKKKAAASGSINVGGGGGAAPPPPAP